MAATSLSWDGQSTPRAIVEKEATKEWIQKLGAEVAVTSDPVEVSLGRGVVHECGGEPP